MMSSNDLLEKIQYAYAQFPKGDIEPFASLFDDDAAMIEADTLPYGGIYKGSAGVKAALLEITSKWWAEIKFDINDFLVGKNHVAAYGRLSAISRTSGNKIDFPLAEVWHIESGRVVTMTPVYYDTAVVVAALS